MGKFLSTLSDIGAGASSIGSALGVAKGVFGLLKGNDNAQQVAQQKSLMDYQYKLNQSAADADNARQRSLMQDQYSINKLGQKQAGINTAFGDANSTVGAASSGSVSPPSALPAQSSIDAQYQSMIGNSAGTLSGVLLNAANTRKADSEARGNEIDNQTRALENLARIRQMIASAKNDEEKAKYQEMENEIMRKFGISNAELDNSIKGSQAHIEEANAAVQGQLNEAELNKKLAELELAKKNGAKVDEEINKVKAEIDELRSRTHLNNTQAGLNVANTGKAVAETGFIGAQTTGQLIDNYVNNATKESVIQAAKLAVKEHGPQSINEYAWSIFNDWDNSTASQKARAVASLPFGIVERALGGASAGAGFSAGNNLTNKALQKKPKPIGFY